MALRILACGESRPNDSILDCDCGQRMFVDRGMEKYVCPRCDVVLVISEPAGQPRTGTKGGAPARRRVMAQQEPGSPEGDLTATGEDEGASETSAPEDETPAETPTEETVPATDEEGAPADPATPAGPVTE